MFLNLVGTFILGVGAAGVVLIIYRVLGRKAPRWLLPAAAGAAMLVVQVWSDYTWHQRAAENLPAGVEVVKTYAEGTPFAPWSYLLPPINRFVAVDLASVRQNKQAPDYAMAKIYLITRYQPGASGTQIFDCVRERRADLGPATKFDDNGLPKNAAWSAVGREDRALAKVCGTK